MKIIIIVMLLAVVVALFSGLFFLVRDPSEQGARRVLTSLKLRIGLSIALIIVLALAAHEGWIKPHGVYPGKHATPQQHSDQAQPTPAP